MRSSVFSKKSFVKLLAYIFTVLIAFAAGRITAPRSAYIDPRISPPLIKAHEDINKTFQFPVKDQKGDIITTLSYTIQSVDVQDQIIIKGQLARTVKGKLLLVVNLKLRNDSDKTIQLNSKDYVRLSQGKSSELLAADVHNDPIQIQPISTVSTKIGFAFDDTNKNLVLRVGEIDGKKTQIPLFTSH